MLLNVKNAMKTSTRLHEDTFVPVGREFCPASVCVPPAHCSSSSAGSVHSPDRGPAPGRDAQPHVALWRWPPPARPDSAPPSAAALHTPASFPPAPSEHWTAKKDCNNSESKHASK